VTSAEKKF